MLVNIKSEICYSVLRINEFERVGSMYLKHLPFIVACISCCFAQDAINSDKDFQHFIVEKSWQAHASLAVNDPDNTGWFSNEYYAKSIYEVIGQAIADCVTHKAEFNPLNLTQIIEFDVKPSDLKNGYTAENWNAVILWNFLNKAIHFHQSLDNIDGTFIEQIGKEVKDYYTKKYDIQNIDAVIRKSVSDIKEYAYALKLYDYINLLRDCKELKTRYAPGCIASQYNEWYNSGSFTILNACVKSKDKIIRGSISINIYNGKMNGYRLDDGSFVELGSKMNVTRTIINGHKPQLLSMIEVHTLPNINSNCWFNSTLIALSASQTYRDAINEKVDWDKPSVSKGANKYTYHVISEIISMLRTGKLSKNKKLYKTLIEKLATADEFSNAIDESREGIEEIYKEYKSDNIHDDTLFSFLLPEKYKWQIVPEQERNELLEEAIKHWKGRSLLRTGSNKVPEAFGILIDALYFEWEKLCVDRSLYAIYYSESNKNVCNRYDENISAAANCDVMCDLDKDIQQYFDKYQSSKAKKRIALLPKILLINIEASGAAPKIGGRVCMQPVKVPLQLKVRDFSGGKQYRLVSTVCSTSQTGGHFLAEVNTTDGWVEIDDSPESIKKIQYHEERPYNSEDNRYRELLVYEREDK